MRNRERHHVKVSAVARAFVLVALLGPALWDRNTPAIIALLTIGTVWTLSTLADWRQRLPVLVVTTVEAALIGAICGFTIHDTLAVLGALAVPPFTAGLYRGIQGVALAMSAQMSAVVVISGSSRWATRQARRQDQCQPSLRQFLRQRGGHTACHAPA